jgi:Domain of unknown function (DUF4333)
MFDTLGKMAGRSLAAIGVAAALVGLTGCSKSVSTADLERTVAEGLEKSTGSKVEKLECPDELKAEVGATVNCTLTDKGKRYNVKVTVNKVEGGTANYDFEVDREIK